MEQEDRVLRALVMSARRANSILERYLAGGVLSLGLPTRSRMELELLKRQLDEFLGVKQNENLPRV